MLKRDENMMPKQWRCIISFVPQIAPKAYQALTPRTEISHMLHSRHKAEIEIITSAPKLTAPTQHIDLQTLLEGGDTVNAFPLVQYLIPKLKFWVTSFCS